jgi:hypothetical protein
MKKDGEARQNPSQSERGGVGVVGAGGGRIRVSVGTKVAAGAGLHRSGDARRWRWCPDLASIPSLPFTNNTVVS